MGHPERISRDALVNATITRFIEVWPDATIRDLAQVMPHIMSEAGLLLPKQQPIRQTARQIIDTLGDNGLLPPWVETWADGPTERAQAS